MEQFILPAIVLVIYVAIIFPMLKKRRDERNLLATLAEGDEIITKSGLHGLVTALDDEILYLEVSEGVELKLSRSAVGFKVDSDTDADT